MYTRRAKWGLQYRRCLQVIHSFLLSQKLLLELKREWRCKIALSSVFLFAFVFTIGGARRMDHPTRNVCLQNNTRNRRRDTINILLPVPARSEYRYIEWPRVRAQEYPTGRKRGTLSLARLDSFLRQETDLCFWLTLSTARAEKNGHSICKINSLVFTSRRDLSALCTWKLRSG